MSSTQPPYYSSSFGDPTQHPSSSQPIGTQVGGIDPGDPRTGPAPHTAGPHKSDIANKLDPRVDSDLSKQKKPSNAGIGGAGGASSIHTGSAQKTAGPHTSNTGNKLDPRVDSDRDNRARHAPGTAASDARTGPAPRTAGPHGFDMGNKLDPRIDSDVDNRAQFAPTTHSHNTSHLGGSGATTSTTAGPHGSKIGNKIDPRVDSDLDNRAQYAPGTTKTGNENPYAMQDTTLSSGSNTGPHESKTMNKLDPRVDAKTGDVSSKTTSQHSRFAGDTHSQYGANITGTTTGSEYASSGVGYWPAESSGSVPGSKSAQKGANVGSGVKGAVAGAHGMGESLRGGLNAAVDKTFGHEEGVAKNDAIASQGEREMRSGNFSRGNIY
ncbi:hypothetical protein BDV26DRAFT_171872 [Aspergillus bertholletiae]|uniref:Cell surface protein n=1 Tax=Aspergillus bertholletiae TaxID=1226010 RepID=A0A5N7BBZ5_9EURO|nr:hypothetical protein BDV26DRAFT_171872 [Aspergillus bertholletiae]